MGGAPKMKIHAKIDEQQTSLSRVTSETGLALRDGATPSNEPDDGARCVGQEHVQRTACANTPNGSRPIAVTDGFLRGACVAHAWRMRGVGCLCSGPAGAADGGVVVVGWLGRASTARHCTHHVHHSVFFLPLLPFGVLISLE